VSIDIIGLDHVTILVSDLDRSLSFYRNTLGLSSLPRPDFPNMKGAWLRLGQIQQLHLIEGLPEAVVSGPRSNHFALQVCDLESSIRTLVDAQACLVGPRERPGAKYLFVIDPDGYYVELFQATDSKTFSSNIS
jgi:glyoxylase I family protein